MFKSIPNLHGTLVSPIGDAAPSMVVDQATADLLRRKLSVGDWTYASISQSGVFEIVRITSITDNLAAIDRAIDSTDAESFLALADIDAILSTSAVEDIVSDVELDEITITGSGLATVSGSDGVYDIHVDPIALTSSSDKLAVAGAYPNYAISVAPILGCCEDPTVVEPA